MMAATKLTLEDTVELPNSVRVPRIGFGVWASSENQCTASCLTALKAGYRHIDTGDCYGNEKEVGDAVRQSGLERSEIFISTKILQAKGSVDESYQSILESIHRLAGVCGSVDMLLIHNAAVELEPRKELWLALEQLYDAKKVRSIGVSNHGIGHIEAMKEYATIWPPHVNQLELHPWCQQRDVEAYCRKRGIVVEAYCPLARNTKADEPTVNAIAKSHGVSAAQVLVRWSLQKGWIPLPKSDTPSRINSNADVFDFELTSEEMKKLDDLDQGAAGALVLAVSND